MEILKTSIEHNERWPRKGIMWVPTFLLQEGDELVFKWQTNNPSRKLTILIEKTDYKADISQNREPLKTITIQDIERYKITKTGLYNFPIENPKDYSEGRIGTLSIDRISNSDISPFTERFYNYHLERENQKITKKCTDWGYSEKIGANIMYPYNDNEPLNRLFSSTTDIFHNIEKEEDKIIKTLFFKASKGEKIVIKPNHSLFKDFQVVTEIQKHNTLGFCLKTHNGIYSSRIEDKCYFISNSNSIYKVETYIYRFNSTKEDNIPSQFNLIEVWSNNHSRYGLLLDGYEFTEVTNEVFNKTELEPIKKVANTM